MNHSFKPQSGETEEFSTKKLDVEAFDPKPLEPEDVEGISLSLGSVTRQRLKIEDPKPEKPKIEKSEEEKMSALRSAMTAFSLVGQIGLILFASVAIGLFGGMHLDRWLGTSPVLLITFTLLGVASGFRAVYLMVKKLM